jgi:peptidoglycan L-alanyl-D-glutamate endopeptidase CwlK
MPDWHRLLFEAPGWQTGLDPTLADKAQQLIDLAAREGITLQVKQGYRSPEEQERLYAQGRSAPGAIVTYARPGQSYHQTGKAIDVVPLKNGQPDDASPHWGRIGHLGKSLGLRWGGDFKRLNDRYHFELPREPTASGAAPAPTTGGLPARREPSVAFRWRVDAMAQRLGANPQDLLDVMSFETAGTFDPAQRNLAGSGAPVRHHDRGVSPDDPGGTVGLCGAVLAAL